MSRTKKATKTWGSDRKSLGGTRRGRIVPICTVYTLGLVRHKKGVILTHCMGQALEGRHDGTMEPYRLQAL